jgi:hypothetical protein
MWSGEEDGVDTVRGSRCVPHVWRSNLWTFLGPGYQRLTRDWLASFKSCPRVYERSEVGYVRLPFA